MKVTNLTDVETKALKQHKLANQHIAVGDKMLAPGASDDIDAATMERVRPALQDMVSNGLLAVGENLPADYLVAKSQLEAAQPAPVPELSAPGPALVHLTPPADPASALTEPAPPESMPPATTDDEPAARPSRSSRGGR